MLCSRGRGWTRLWGVASSVACRGLASRLLTLTLTLTLTVTLTQAACGRRAPRLLTLTLTLTVTLTLTQAACRRSASRCRRPRCAPDRSDLDLDLCLYHTSLHSRLETHEPPLSLSPLSLVLHRVTSLTLPHPSPPNPNPNPSP